MSKRVIEPDPWGWLHQNHTYEDWATYLESSEVHSLVQKSLRQKERVQVYKPTQKKRKGAAAPK